MCMILFFTHTYTFRAGLPEAGTVIFGAPVTRQDLQVQVQHAHHDVDTLLY